MQNTVILVTNDGMGRADTTLQHTLIVKYLDLLWRMGNYQIQSVFTRTVSKWLWIAHRYWRN
jgi:hypothetical protein